MGPSQTFPIRFGMFRPLLWLMGAGPGSSAVEVDADRLRTRMGPHFRADVPLTSIRAVRPFTGLVGGIGVHGWRGRWLVNGAARGVVEIDIDPPARARVLGVPVRLRTLQVSVESPEELIAVLRR